MGKKNIIQKNHLIKERILLISKLNIKSDKIINILLIMFLKNNIITL